MSILTRLSAATYEAEAFAGPTPQHDFALSNARAMMWLSQLAYEVDDVAKVTTILTHWALQLPPGGLISTKAMSTLPITRARAILTRGPDVAVLAFAGTDPLVVTDWVSDFNISPQGETTDGFAQAVATAMPIIRRLLAGITVPLVVTGHSLGGALATLAALDLAKEGLPVAAVYTFGTPRPGGSAFRDDYDALLGAVTYRLVLGDDIVPTVAPSMLGFRHVGRLLHQPRNTAFEAANLDAAPGSDEPSFGAPGMASLLHDWEAALRGFGLEGPADGSGPDWSGRPNTVALLLEALPPGIKDHLPDSYIAALN